MVGVVMEVVLDVVVDKEVEEDRDIRKKLSIT